jgi:hypothetical protein
MMRRRIAAALVIAGALLAGVPAQAQYYRWTDDQGNSHYTDGLHAIPERFRSRAVPLGLRPSPSPAPAPAPTEGPAATAAAPSSPGAVGSTTIRYTPGQPIMVDVSINGRARARLVLETEAEVTQIKPDVLASAGVALPAEGSPHASVTLDSLTLGEARVTRLPVVAQDVRPGEDGLLGRDFLDRFTVANDPQGGVLTLTPR